MKLRTLDLFSGIGGFSLGLEATKQFKTISFCEIDPFCRKVLAKHWPDVPCFEDITKLGREELDGLGKVDVICGGFPCQDISCAGKGAGIHADRSGLWWEMLRVIRLVRPRYVLVENVADIFIRGFDEVLGGLSEIGYNAQWTTLRACDFGLPHRRRRLFLVAYPQGKYGAKTSMLFKSRIWHTTRDTTWNGRENELGRLLSLENWTEEDAKRSNGGESIICRKNDGVRTRMDRLRSLGNAICPPVAQFVAECVLDFDRKR